MHPRLSPFESLQISLTDLIDGHTTNKMAAVPTVDPAERAARFLFDRNMEQLLPEIVKATTAAVGATTSQMLGEQSAFAAQLSRITELLTTLERNHGARLDAIAQALSGGGPAPPVAARPRAAPVAPAVAAAGAAAGGAGGAAAEEPATPLDPMKAGSHKTSQNFWKLKFADLIGSGPECVAEAEALAGGINALLAKNNAAAHATVTKEQILSVWGGLSKKAAKSKDPAERSAGGSNGLFRLLTKEQKDGLKAEWEERKKAELIAGATPQLTTAT